jgi:hypothetical protein
LHIAYNICSVLAFSDFLNLVPRDKLLAGTPMEDFCIARKNRKTHLWKTCELQRIVREENLATVYHSSFDVRGDFVRREARTYF